MLSFSFARFAAPRSGFFHMAGRFSRSFHEHPEQLHAKVLGNCHAKEVANPLFDEPVVLTA